MTSEYKEYIDTTDPAKKIRCDVFYFPKCYRASVTLVEIEDHGNGMRSESHTIFQDDINQTLLKVDRKSKKATDQAIELFRAAKDTLISTLLKGRNVTLLKDEKEQNTFTTV